MPKPLEKSIQSIIYLKFNFLWPKIVFNLFLFSEYIDYHFAKETSTQPPIVPTILNGPDMEIVKTKLGLKATMKCFVQHRKEKMVSENEKRIRKLLGSLGKWIGVFLLPLILVFYYPLPLIRLLSCLGLLAIRVFLIRKKSLKSCYFYLQSIYKALQEKLFEKKQFKLLV